MLLPLLAFVFGSLLIAAAAMALVAEPRRRHRSPPRRADQRRATEDAGRSRGYQSLDRHS